MRYLTSLALVGFLASHAAAEVDLSKAPRRIAVEPTYTAEEPLYGLVVFGPKATTRVWMVLDKSKAEVDTYDVLYADLNANGDLTDKGERIAAESGSSGNSSQFKLPDFTDPDGGAKHTDFSLRVTRGKQPIFMVSVSWRGKREMKFGGGYAVDGANGYMRFAETAKEAPIAWLNGDGPFRFQRWYSEKLRIGEADDVKVFLGQQGIGDHSFCAFQRHVLPDDEPVLAILIYTDTDGTERRLDYELKERC